MMVVCVLGNALCTLAISFFSNYYILSLARFFNGMFNVNFAIFNPVWIDQFIPKHSASVIMAIHHVESILGTVLGFLLTSRLSLVVSWRYSFLIQSILHFVFFFITALISKVFFTRTMQRVGDTDVFILSEVVGQDDAADTTNDYNKKSLTRSEKHKAMKFQEELVDMTDKTDKNLNDSRKHSLEERRENLGNKEVVVVNSDNDLAFEKKQSILSASSDEFSILGKIDEGKTGRSYFQVFLELITNKVSNF